MQKRVTTLFSICAEKHSLLELGNVKERHLFSVWTPHCPLAIWKKGGYSMVALMTVHQCKLFGNNSSALTSCVTIDKLVMWLNLSMRV